MTKSDGSVKGSEGVEGELKIPSKILLHEMK